MIKKLLTFFLILFFTGIVFADNQKILKVYHIRSNYYLDPAIEWDSTSSLFVRNIYERLVEVDWHSYKPVPSLAIRWKTEDGGKTWIFYLRKGVKFQNGEEFDADSVVFSFRRLIDKEFPYYVKKASAFREIVPYLYRVEKLSKYKVKFYLKKIFAPFVLSLSIDSASIVSPSAVKLHKNRFYRYGAGTGAFSFENGDHTKVILIKNKNYWGNSGNVEKVIVYFKNFRNIMSDFEKKRCDMIFAYSISKLKYLEKVSWVKVKRTPMMSVEFLVFNPHKNKYLRNKNLRKAFFYAWNPNILVYEFQNTLKPFSLFFPKGMPGYIDELSTHEFSMKKARYYMNLSGVPKNTVFEIPALKDAELFVSLLMRYAKLLRKIGINLRVVFADDKEIDKKFATGDYDIAINSWIYDYPDPDNMLVALFSKKIYDLGYPNLFYFLTPKLSSLIEAGKRELNYEKRKAIYEKITKMIHDETMAIPVGLNMKIVTYKKRLNNLIVYPDGSIDFKKIHLK